MKSYVSLEQKMCLVCGSHYDTNNLLLDKHLRSSMNQHTVTGWGLCPEHKKLFDDGFIALIECDEQRSDIQPDTNQIDPAQAYRTGRIAHLKQDVFLQIFDAIAPKQACVFVEQGVIEKLQQSVIQDA